MDYYCYAEWDTEEWPTREKIESLADYLYERAHGIASFSEPSTPQFIGIRATIKVSIAPFGETFQAGARSSFSTAYVRHLALCIDAFEAVGVKVRPEGLRVIEISRGDAINAETKELVDFFEKVGELDVDYLDVDDDPVPPG
jgi:hypothetical protein